MLVPKISRETRFFQDLRVSGRGQLRNLIGVWHVRCSQREDQSRFTQFHREADMLVLSRKQGEQLRIGEDIVLTVNRVSGNRVAIGIEAPRDVRIVRGELQRHQVADGGTAATAMSMGDSTVAVASKPH